MKHLLLVIFIVKTINITGATILSGQVKGVHQVQTFLVNVPFDCWYYKQLSKEIITDGKGYFTSSITVERPQSIFVEYKNKRILVYAEPGKNISFSFDSSDLTRTLRFDGVLKTENEFRKNIGLTFFSLYPQSWNDSTSSSSEIIASIKRNQVITLKKLHDLKSNTSSAFKTITKADIEYFLPVKIWNIIYSNRDPLRQNRTEWQEALQRAYRFYPLSNGNAVNSYYYQNTTTYYARYLKAAAADREAFEKVTEDIFKMKFDSAYLRAKGKRYWEYKAFNYGLTGPALEQAIASFVDNGINIGDLNYLQEAYSDFLFHYPESVYRRHLEKIMAPYFASQSGNKAVETLFEPVGEASQTLKDILSKHKGKVVYIDLWGTWCGPCRQEFLYNEPMKFYFAGKPVDFIYIAFEHESADPEVMWKKTVKYYKLTGRHILATDQLKADLDKVYAPGGLTTYPGYMLVDKDGNIQNLYAGRPSSPDLLYKQIEQLLN